MDPGTLEPKLRIRAAGGEVEEGKAKGTPVEAKLWVNGEAPLKEVIALVKKTELTGRCAKAVASEIQEFKQLSMVKGGKDFAKNKTGRRMTLEFEDIVQLFL
ncbi:hypothetical protein NDU88_004269 [Pleurodeles waltl]|uniref:Uncharacterized protein n=1 Tax=Pleurodeles waltl TaxID=8319 RepID=A0AAV7M5W4_PLEWA|nr:hypothetical protein NDU88_004269 [Pleurodeles waltl]